MSLILTEEQQMLAETAQGFFTDKAPVSALRKLRDTKDVKGYDPALWNDMAQMGFSGVLISEDYGGVEMGYQAAGLIAEQIGRNLTASPYLSTAILAAEALRHTSKAQQSNWLPKIASGETIMALAVDEGARHNPAGISLSATRSGNGFRLSGEKTMVLDGHVADQIIVAARTSGAPGTLDGLTLFMVNPSADGLERERVIMVNSRNSARLSFNDVDVTADAVIGDVDAGGAILNQLLNAGRAMTAAEMLGAGSAAFMQMTEYLQIRRQFGMPIGSFQALQHRAAHLYAELEVARSAVYAALSALDKKAPDSDLIVAMTKAKLGQVAQLAATESLQLHGGIGMTDEHDIGLFLKHVRASQALFGDANYHLDIVAKLKGY